MKTHPRNRGRFAPGMCATAILLCGASGASAAHYPLRLIRIAGGSDIRATAINDKGHIAGTYSNAGGNNGFLLRGNTVTVLSQSCQGGGGSCVPIPTALTRGDKVGGFYALGPYNNPGFVWDNGVYVTSQKFNVGDLEANIFVALNERGDVAFNNTQNIQVTAYTGPASAPAPITAVANAVVNSINKTGDVAGNYLDYNKGVQAIFVIHAGKAIEIMPSGATQMMGGYVNDNGQVAGTYVDASGRTLGLVYQNGKIAHFRFPAHASRILMQAFSDQGHAVGTYWDGSFQRVFIYNGAVVNVFGHFPTSDNVGTALNNSGDIIVSDAPGSGPTISYKTKCEGSGC